MWLFTLHKEIFDKAWTFHWLVFHTLSHTLLPNPLSSVLYLYLSPVPSSIASSFSTHLLRSAVLLHIRLQSPQLSSVPVLSSVLRATRWQETQHHTVCFSTPRSDSQHYEFDVSCWVPASRSWLRLRSGVSGVLLTACYGNAVLESLIWA